MTKELIKEFQHIVNLYEKPKGFGFHNEAFRKWDLLKKKLKGVKTTDWKKMRMFKQIIYCIMKNCTYDEKLTVQEYVDGKIPVRFRK